MSDDDDSSKGDGEEFAALLDAAFARDLRPDKLAPEKLDGMRQRIRRRVREKHAPGTRTIRSDELNWRETMPGVRTKVLSEEKAAGMQTFLVHMDPGAEVPEHLHPVHEECLVLRGDLQIGELELSAGDAHFADPGSTHATLRTRNGVVLLIRMGNPVA
jgi:quercetin dioxygenase-like cupin family protein